MAFQPIACPDGSGSGGASSDVEHTLLCDVAADGSRIATVIMVQEYDQDGVPVGAPIPTNPATGLPYVVVGTLIACEEAGADVEQLLLCDLQPDNSAVQFIRHYVHSTDDGQLVPAEMFDTLPDGTAYTPTGTVGACDPYRQCIPASNQDLAGTCGPGEPASQPIILADGQAPDSTIVDDPTADALCGGSWGPGPDPQPAPFPVVESFRNNTYDEPPFVDQGTPPYPQLTSGGIDAVGDGWLRVSDINSGTNGMHQLVTPFSNSDNTTAGVTFAAHDGTAQGGDGLVFALTDGAEPGGQGAAIGGFGNLGLANWEGGYVGVVLDEYGQTCSDSGTGPFAGPGPFCGNTISIQTIGPARLGQGPAGVIASAPLAPHFINQTTRSAPAKLITSVITEAGQTYVSASIDWNDGAGPVQYFNRVNVTPVAGPAPSTFRMAAYGGSGGGLRDIKEFRDLTAQAGGIQDWRAFPIETDPIPACVTQVSVTAEVDVTFVSDSQTAGNADNEAWFWLVNVATNTIIDRGQVSSLPSQVGTPHHLSITSGLIPVADLANLRIYVGAETRDASGSYGHLWENLDVSVSGTGCPVVPRRTMEISAVCPIPVTIVGGGTGDGEAAAPAVFNAPATFEDAAICATIAGVQQPAFRREVRAPDGNITFSFLGTDGVPITPDTWTAGACPAGDTELLTVCDLGTDPPTPFVRRVTYDGAGVVISSEDTDYTGVPYVPAGVAGPCPECGPAVLGNVCITSADFPGVTLPAVAVQACDGTMTYLNAATGIPWPNQTAVVVCPPENQTWEEILCDAGNGGAQFRRIYNLTALGSVVFYDEDLEAAPYVVVGPAEVCAGQLVQLCDLDAVNANIIQFLRRYTSAGPVDFAMDGTTPYVVVGQVIDCARATVDVEQEILCDFGTLDFPGGAPHQFLRAYRTYNAFGNPIIAPFNFLDTELDGANPYVPVGPVAQCAAAGVDVEILEMCDQAGISTVIPFYRRFTYDAAGVVIAVADFDGDDLPYVVTGTARIGHCDAARVEHEILCDNPSGVNFLRVWRYAEEGASPAGFNDYALDGVTPYVVAGTAGRCSTSTVLAEFDEELLILCDSAAPTPNRFLRRYSYDAETPGAGIVITNTTLDGVTPFAPVGAVQVCPNVTDIDFDQIELCDNNGGFLRRFTFNSTTGAVIATTNLTLAGAAYVPVGTVGICDGCCPTVVGQGCTNTGSGTYVAIRSSAGVVSLFDAVTGAAIVAANVVACPGTGVVTLNSQARLLTNAAPWTPGADVTGTLTGLSFTVLTGTADLVDSNATVSAGLPAGVTLDWQAEDANTLTPPASMTPSVGGSTLAVWTQR